MRDAQRPARSDGIPLSISRARERLASGMAAAPGTRAGDDSGLPRVSVCRVEAGAQAGMMIRLSRTARGVSLRFTPMQVLEFMRRATGAVHGRCFSKTLACFAQWPMHEGLWART